MHHPNIFNIFLLELHYINFTSKIFGWLCVKGEMSSWDEANGLEESPDIPSEGLAMGDSATCFCNGSLLLVASCLLVVLCYFEKGFATQQY